MLLYVAFELMLFAQTPNAEQFAQLARAGLGEIRDTAFIFEGRAEYVGPASAVKGDPKRLSTIVQGSYADRSDGALFKDIYRRGPEGGNPFTRETAAILNNMTTSVSQLPDQKHVESRSTPGRSPGGIMGFESPLRLVYTWLFQPITLKDLVGYKCHGRERVDGIDCLHVEFDSIPGIKKNPPWRRHFWIDTERGWHPIKVEYREGDRLISRNTITLMKVKEGSNSYWFPKSAVIESFGFNRQFSDKPFFRTNISIVPTSLRLNQGLTDDVFKIDSKGGVADTSGLVSLRDEFLKPKQLPREYRRTDVKSVQESLDTDLAKADEQAKRLTASAPSTSDPTPWIQIVLSIVGVVLISGAAYWTWIRRR